MDWKLAAAAGAALVATGFAPAPPSAHPTGHGVAPNAPPTSVMAKPSATGPQYYLSGAAVPDVLQIIPPAPAKGDIRDEADRATFLATRKLEGSPRWALATFDDSGPPAKVFACALGVELTPQNAPKFSAMIPRIAREAIRAMNAAKDTFKRPRPFLLASGATCIDQKGPIKDSWDYPSGHTTFSWALGVILAELAPDRGTQVLARARSFGESRLICGVHSMSAVEEGRTTGAVVAAALHGSPEFRADLDAARREIAAARKAGPAPDPAQCAREAQLIAKSPF